MSQRPSIPLANLSSHVGEHFFTSPWLRVDSEHLAGFATATYLDADHANLTAAKNNPLGATLVDGFLLTSMLTMFHFNNSPVIGSGIYGFNYGLDRVRYTHPVFVGDDIRCVSSVEDVTTRPDGTSLLTTDNKFEIQGSTKPAMVARWLTLFATRDDGLDV